ncbi:hypothetical protein BO82DRAFT_270247, partial [Aspergillus uvarum CBS 121591]
FKYTGQPADLALIEQIAKLLEQNKIPCHVINDSMWRHFGCQNPINSLDIIIPRSLQKQAVLVLRKANFDDGCRQEDKYEAVSCNFIYNLRANFHRAWWVPAHVFHLQPAAPGEELHVDLNLFSHEDWFPNLELPACGPLAEDDETYLVSTDTRL